MRFGRLVRAISSIKLSAIYSFFLYSSSLRGVFLLLIIKLNKFWGLLLFKHEVKELNRGENKLYVIISYDKIKRSVQHTTEKLKKFETERAPGSFYNIILSNLLPFVNYAPYREYFYYP